MLPYPGCRNSFCSLRKRQREEGALHSSPNPSESDWMKREQHHQQQIKWLLNPSLSRRPPLAKNFRVSGTTIGRYGIAYGGTSHGRFPLLNRAAIHSGLSPLGDLPNLEPSPLLDQRTGTGPRPVGGASLLYSSQCRRDSL